MPAPPRAAFEPPQLADEAAEETVINFAVTPRAIAPEIVPPPRQAPPQPRPMESLPPVSMSLPPESGLELVETHSKAVLMPEPEPAPVGARRVRPPRVVIADEPLQIIETRKENSPPAG
jgi:hypothetical protein